MGDVRDSNGVSSTPNGEGTTSEPKGLKVFIVGGGIAGFTAAIALRQQGHEVEVFEQSRLANEVGAAIHMCPNAMGVLLHLGVDPKDSGAIPLRQTRFYTGANKLFRTNDEAKAAGRWQNPWLLAHRAHLHTQLKNTATSTKAPGTPVILHTSSRVATADAENATVTVDGTTRSCDVVIGADGVHSNTRAAVVPDAPEPHKGQHNAFRFIIPRKAVLDDPEVKHLAEEYGSMDMWYGPDRKIVLYPTTNNELLNFVCIHPASLSDPSNDYNTVASKEKLLQVYEGFDPTVVKMVAKADADTLKVYPLFDMAKLPTFVRGRLALIGDAAHPFTPHLAQGGAQAIEDAVSLGVMLGCGVTTEEVPARLGLFNQARYERASTIQNYSRIVGGDGTADTNKKGETFKVHDFIDYGMRHDEVHASTQILREFLWSQQPVIWRQPKVFGPMPGPRQDAMGTPRRASLSLSSVRTITIKFKTSATLLRNLFPNKSYSFASNDSVAVARFTVQSMQNMAWLGGGGYDLLALYVDGVDYTQKNGEVLHGTYCPVMFENLADPILSGREELGIPKVFSDIDISNAAGECKVAVSWRGNKWAEFEWSGLQPQQTTEARPQEEISDNGLLVHKYIPATGQEKRGQADVEYDVFVPRFEKSSPGTSKKTTRSSQSHFKILDLGVSKLPTIHHIVARLAELPVFEILEGTLSETDGVDDLSSARILD